MRLARPVAPAWRPRDLPWWAWLTLAALTVMVLLPVVLRLYAAWWLFAFGTTMLPAAVGP